MTHILCPLCGKQTFINNFKPEYLDLDIYEVEVRGLGRGKGFETSERYSILGDEEVTPKIVTRVEVLYHFFIERGLLEFDAPSQGTDEKIRGELASLHKTADEKTDQITQLEQILLQWQNSYKEQQRRLDVVAKESRILSEKNRRLANELEEAETKNAQKEEDLNLLADRIADHLEEERDSEEDVVEYIDDGLDRILEDVDSLRAEVEE